MTDKFHTASLTTSGVRTTTWWAGAACVLLALCAGMSLSFVHARPLLMSDSLTYIDGARALANGEGYRQAGAAITVRPPGYSAVLVPLMWAGAGTVLSFKILNVLFASAALALYLLVLRPLGGRWQALLAVGASGLCFPWVYYSHAILAEMLFTLLLAAFLAAAMRYAERPEPRLAWGMGALCAALPIIRFAGIALLPVLALAVTFSGSASEKTRSFGTRLIRMGIFVGMASIPTALYLLRNLCLTGGATSYDAGLSDEYLLSLKQGGFAEPTLWIRLWVNIRGYLHILVVPDQTGIARIARLPFWLHGGCLAFWALVAVGGLRTARERAGRLVLAACVCSGGILLVNPWYDIRYLLPILPAILLYAACGIGAVTGLCLSGFRSARARWVRFVAAPTTWACAFLTGLLLCNLAFLVASPKAGNLRSASYSGAAQRLYEAAVFIKTCIEPGKVLVAGTPGFVPLWTGRPVLSALSLKNNAQPAAAHRIPEDVAFVLLDESSFGSMYRMECMEPLVRANTNVLHVVFQSGDTLVYKHSPLSHP